MSKQVTAVLVVAILVLALVGYLVKHQIRMVLQGGQPTPVPAMIDQSTPSLSASSPLPQGVAKEFTVTGSNFSFSPATLTVNKGDTVKINFKNSSGTHNLTLPDFNVATKTISSGDSDSITFTASKTGSFEYFCSVGNHRAMGMKGTLTVQ